MRYKAQEKAWVRKILARLNPEQRKRYEELCRHRNRRLYARERAEIAERILLEDAWKEAE